MLNKRKYLQNICKTILGGGKMVQWLKCIMFLTRIWVLFQAPMSGWLQLDLIADFWKQVPLSFLCRCLHPCTHLHTDACTHINKKNIIFGCGTIKPTHNRHHNFIVRFISLQFSGVLLLLFLLMFGFIVLSWFY